MHQSLKTLKTVIKLLLKGLALSASSLLVYKYMYIPTISDKYDSIFIWGVYNRPGNPITQYTTLGQGRNINHT